MDGVYFLGGCSLSKQLYLCSGIQSHLRTNHIDSLGIAPNSYSMTAILHSHFYPNTISPHSIYCWVCSKFMFCLLDRAQAHGSRKEPIVWNEASTH